MPPAAKRCSRCERVLPVSAFCRHARAVDGFRSRCRECEGRLRRLVPPPVDAVSGYKHCPRCELVLPLDAFAVDSTAATGRRSHCRECIRRARDASPEVRQRRLDRRVALAVRQGAAAAALVAGEKRCPTCEKVKPLDAFWRRTDRLDGRSVSCAACIGIKRNAPEPEDVERAERWAATAVETDRMIEEARREH